MNVHRNARTTPNMPEDMQKRDVLVGIDRATRWVYMEVITDKTAKTAAKFIEILVAKYPIKITKILMDNGKEFTD
ncbi:DDE-type integrase/transposase/recombinase [Leucothrix arctica]|uniref:Integrase catalytic domain-containing protein n=1 Tax=Leucothrix arctica TaxID=1481894 RepID=A0A317C3U4_9GAMM|nr:DDE-type integrase/transposase/recombinase [Leucothrix arctica]PWQ93366.1 hypothetical protein DKT75_17160 [Leucothrix arctica]